MTSVQKIESEHFTCVSQPGGKYLDHLTLDNGTGHSIASEVVALVRERGVYLVVLGMDGTKVNTGIHNGVFHLVELVPGYPLQDVVCLMHHNELPL